MRCHTHTDEIHTILNGHLTAAANVLRGRPERKIKTMVLLLPSTTT
jgi:hypothetical protein